MACDEDRKRENSFVDLQRFGVGVAALMLAESVKLEPKKKLVQTVSWIERLMSREVDASIFSLSHTHTNTHMTNIVMCWVTSSLAALEYHSATSIPLLASCFVYMDLSYVLNEILNSHEFTQRTTKRSITKVSHCIQFSWADATVFFDLALVQHQFFFSFILSVFSLA